MLNLIRATMAVAVCFGVTTTIGWAQGAKISVAAASSDRLQEDLKSMIDLAPVNLKKQWQTLKDVLDSFVQGVDTKKPIGLDILFGGQELNYVLKVPVTEMGGRNGFVNNVQAFGFKVAGPDATGVYTVTQVRAAPRRGPRGRRPAPAAPPAKPFYMREANGHALLAPAANLLPKTFAPADQAKLVPGATDAAARLDNSADDIEARRDAFTELRKQLEAAVEFRRGETPEQLKLRKLSLEQNLNEAERFLIESDVLDANWTTDGARGTGHGDLSLTALPGTALAESIDILSQAPSKFANVKFAPQAALQLRINFAADDMRSQHAADLYAALLPVMQAEMDKRPHLTAEGKATAKEALAKLFGMLKDSIPLKVLDAFVDVHASSDGKNTGICGIRTADGTKATEILAMFPKIRAGWQFKEAAAEHGGVSIHELTVAPHRKEEFAAVFGGQPVIYIGTSKDVVWGAAGAGGLEALKAAIDQAAAPAPEMVDPVFTHLEMKFSAWVKLLDVIRAKAPATETTDKEQLEFERQRDKVRKYALEAFAEGDDVLKSQLRREGDKVVGTLDIQKGILRLIGTVLADFTAENLR